MNIYGLNSDFFIICALRLRSECAKNLINKMNLILIHKILCRNLLILQEHIKILTFYFISNVAIYFFERDRLYMQRFLKVNCLAGKFIVQKQYHSDFKFNQRLSPINNNHTNLGLTTLSLLDGCRYEIHKFITFSHIVNFVFTSTH